jgi:hypothetical protein
MCKKFGIALFQQPKWTGHGQWDLSIPLIVSEGVMLYTHKLEAGVTTALMSMYISISSQDC